MTTATDSIAALRRYAGRDRAHRVSGPPGAIRAARLERACDLVIGSPSKYASREQRQAALCIVKDRSQELFRRDLPALSERQWNRLIKRLEARYGTAS